MLLKHSASYLLARGVPALVNFTAVVLYTRLLAPDEYGHYALVLAVVAFANGVLFEWLHLGLVRYLPGFRGPLPVFLSTLLAGFVLAMALSTVSALAIRLLLPDGPERRLALLGLALLWAWSFFDVNQQLENARLRPAAYGRLGIARALLALGLGGWLAWLGSGAAGPLWGLLAGTSVPVALFAGTQWRNVRLQLVDRGLLRRLLAYGLPLAATLALSLTVNSSDRLLLGWLRGAGETGLYAVGYDLPNHALGVLMLIVNLAAFPLAVSALERGGLEAARDQLGRHAVLLLGLALPAAAGLMLLAPGLAGLLLGQEFQAAAARLIPWIALGTLLFGLKSYYFDLAFQLGQHTVGQVWVLLAAAAANLLLNLLLIPGHGAMGAAYATVAAYGLGLGLSVLYGRRRFPLPLPWGELGKVAASTAAMALLLWPLRELRGATALAGTLLAGCTVYGIVLLLLDTAGIRGILKRRFFRPDGGT